MLREFHRWDAATKKDLLLAATPLTSLNGDTVSRALLMTLSDWLDCMDEVGTPDTPAPLLPLSSCCWWRTQDLFTARFFLQLAVNTSHICVLFATKPAGRYAVQLLCPQTLSSYHCWWAQGFFAAGFPAACSPYQTSSKFLSTYEFFVFLKQKARLADSFDISLYYQKKEVLPPHDSFGLKQYFLMWKYPSFLTATFKAPHHRTGE